MRNVTQKVQAMNPPLGQTPFQLSIGRKGSPNHIRCQECRNDTHCHDHGIEEVAYHTQRQTERGDDKGKLTNLRHRKTTTHSCLQRLSAQHITRGAKHSLSENDGQRKHHNGHPLRNKDFRIHQHTYRHEENSTEEVLHGFNQSDNLIGFDGFCQYATHDKRSKGGAEACLCGNDCHEET